MEIKRRVLRFDLGELRESSRTPQGFLRVPGFATRVGVFPYMDGSGKVRRELRHPDDVFDPQSMETLKYAPVTIEHPPEMITPENVDQYRVGHTTEKVVKIEDKLDTELIIENAEAIDAVEKEGIRELSCGYAADIVEEEGDFNGAPYDFRQVNIRYNHLAMVKRGRAGPEIRMRLDSADAVMQGEISVPARGEFSQEPGVADSGVAATMKEFAKGTLKSGSGHTVTDPKQAAAIGYSEERGHSDEEGNAVGEPESKKLVISGQEVELPSDVADTVQDYIDRFDEMRAKIAQMEEEMKAGRKDNKDADISQPGISPQVKVEQQGPDGKAAGGKTAAKPGTITGPVGKGDDDDDDDEEGKKDEDQHGVVGGEKPSGRAEGGKALADVELGSGMAPATVENDFAAGAGTGAGGAAMSPVERMKQDIEAIRDAYKGDADLHEKLDALEGKMDAFASESMGKPEKRGDSRQTRVDAVDQQIRRRVKLERQAEKLVPFEIAQKFDGMNDDQIRAAVISHNNPRADLAGKSSTYLQARFDGMLETIEETDSSEYRREMGRGLMGIDGENRLDGEEVDPNAARLRMIKSGREEFKSNLSASKK